MIRTLGFKKKKLAPDTTQAIDLGTDFQAIKYEGRMSAVNIWGRDPEGSGIETNFTHRPCMLLSTPTT